MCPLDANRAGLRVHCQCLQGMLGIACSLKGSPHVLGIDIDEDALHQAAQNIEEFEELPMQLLAADVCTALPFRRLPAADIVISNPPFGAWRKGADCEFLAAAAKVWHCNTGTVRSHLPLPWPTHGADSQPGLQYASTPQRLHLHSTASRGNNAVSCRSLTWCMAPP